MKKNRVILIVVLILVFIFSRIDSKNKYREYNRLVVLDTLAETLDMINEPWDWTKGYSVKDYDDNGLLTKFYVIDLSCLENKETNKSNTKIKFFENHVYHFYPVFTDMLIYSGILIIHNEKFYIFHSIDCEKEGASGLDDIVNFISDSLSNIDDKEEIMKRVKNYNDYIDFVTGFSEVPFNCDTENNK